MELDVSQSAREQINELRKQLAVLIDQIIEEADGFDPRDDPHDLLWEPNDWYYGAMVPAALADVTRKIDKYFDTGDRPVVVHRHPQVVDGVKIYGLHSEVCGLSDCYAVYKED